MEELTAAQKVVLREYKRPFIDLLNQRDIIDALHLQKAKKSGYICPCCGSGAGGNKTGAEVTRDHRRITCFANINCPLNGNGKGQDVYGALQATTGKSGNEILKEHFSNYDAAAALKGTEKAVKPRPAFEPVNVYTIPKKPAESEIRANTADYTEYYKRSREHITDAAALQYLSFRGISLETADKYWLGFDPEADPASAPGAMGDEYKPHPCPRIIIPFDKGHYMGRRTDGESEYKAMNSRNYGDGDGIALFNVKALQNESGRPVYVVEGAFDALSIIEVGGEAVALNSTSNVSKLITHLKQHKTRCTLIICLDNDDAGRKAADTLADGLKELNIPYVTADLTDGKHKDANEALIADRIMFAQNVGVGERSTRQPDNTADYISRYMTDEILKFKADATRPTGFKNLDKAAGGGIYAGLYTVGGISSVGKTTFCAQLCEQLAEQGQHVLYFSMEQSRLELVSKSIARRTAEKDVSTKVTSLSIRKGNLPQAALDAALEYVRAVGNRLSIIEGNFDCTVSYIRDYATKYKELNGVRPVVCVDYLQTLKADIDPQTGRKPTDARQIVENNVIELKRLSRSLEIPVFMISSVNRSNYLTPIDFEAFKESGGIEFTSDVVWGLQLDAINDDIFNKEGKIKEKREKIKEAKAAMPRNIQLVCLKNRYGISSYTAQFLYYPQHDLFTEFDELQLPANVRRL